MRRFILPVFDVVVCGSFALFLGLMAAGIPSEVRTRLVSGIWTVLRQTGGF